MTKALAAGVIVAFALGTSSHVASAAPAAAHFLPHSTGMTLTQKVDYFKRSHAREAMLASWLSSPAAPRTAERLRLRRWYLRAANWHRNLIVRYTGKLHHEQRLAAARRLAAVGSGLPWAFWNCVASGWTGGSPGSGSRVSVGEGGATSVDPSGTYFGRYQMDSTFMSSHGSDMLRKYGGRDARSWTVLDQTIVAERGFQSQGAGAWPHTAPPCVYLR